MDLFAPENLPAVGMGSALTVSGLCGLIGMAATSGALVAEGAIGTVAFTLGAISVLAEKPDFGGSTPAALAVLGLLLLLVAARLLLLGRARREAAALAGAAADAPETKAARAAIARRERYARLLTGIAVAWAGAAAGFAWSEWNEVPFRLGDTESLVGLALGLVAAAVAGDAAWRFLQGALGAGGSVVVVGVVVTVVAFALNVASVYVPFFGLLVLLASAALALRLRRRAATKHAGLRILS